MSSHNLGAAGTADYGAKLSKTALRLTPLVLYAMLGVALVWWSWLKWTDPLIDFGRELYIPWQLTRGQMLYRDIASLFGPLSPYVNALWFTLFGVSLRTLVAANLVIFALAMAGVHRMIDWAADRATAHVATVIAVVLFGFTQYTDVANYNFVTPYAHGATHGVALAVATLIGATLALSRRSFPWAATSGIGFGLLVLTKPETPVACFAGLACGVAVSARRGSRAWLLAASMIFAIAASLAPALFLVYFRYSGPMPWQRALEAVGSGWTALRPTIFANKFYATAMGADRPVINALWSAMAFGVCAAYAGLAVAVECRSRATTRWIGRALLAVSGVGLSLSLALPRALPLLALIAWIGDVATTDAHDDLHHHADAACRRNSETRRLARVTWAGFATVLLAKIWLNASIARYGFYLALPAMTLAVVIVMDTIPRRVAGFATFEAAGRTRRTLAASLAAIVVPYMALSATWYRAKVVQVGSGADRFLVSSMESGQPEGGSVQDVVGRINRLTKPEDTVTVLPDGAMINYLSRRRTSVPVITFMPPELIAFGEAAIVRTFEDQPPDFIVLLSRDTREYGYAAFGADGYGGLIRDWIDRRYDTTESGAGFEIRKRRPVRGAYALQPVASRVPPTQPR